MSTFLSKPVLPTSVRVAAAVAALLAAVAAAPVAAQVSATPGAPSVTTPAHLLAGPIKLS